MCVYHVAQAGLELVMYVAKDDSELQIFHPWSTGAGRTTLDSCGTGY